MEGDDRPGKEPVGFEGLARLVSDGSADLARLRAFTRKRTEDARRPAPERGTDVGDRPSREGATGRGAGSTSQSPTSSKSSGLWPLVGGLLVLVWVAIAINSDSQGSSPAPRTSRPQQPPPSAVPAPTRPPTPGRQPLPAVNNAWREERPAAGTGNILTREQLRYCLSESVRIDAADPVVNGNSQAEVDGFNRVVSDYNVRCSNFQYQVDQMQSVRAEVDGRRAQLQAEGRRWVSGWRREEDEQSSAPGPQSREEPVPDRVSPPQRPASPSSRPDAQKATGLPSNAEPNPFGGGWTCRRGYVQVGQACKLVEMPANAEIDLSGRAWTCRRGYVQVGEACERVQMPANAEIDLSGRAWTCRRGYVQVGASCQQVLVPPNASLDYTGRAWTCNSGFVRQGDRCVKSGDSEGGT